VTTGTARPAEPSRGARAGLALTVVVQLVVLYWPRSPSTGGLPIDKLVHAAIFGAVLWAAARARADLRLVGGLLVAHAVVSELVQHFVLPNRSGDWTDSVADVTGVLIVTLFLRARS
jgi:VanZ like family